MIYAGNLIYKEQVNYVTSITSIYTDPGWVSDQPAQGTTMVLMDASAGPPQQVADVTALACTSNGAAAGMLGFSRSGPGVVGITGFAFGPTPKPVAGVYGHVLNTQSGVGVQGEVDRANAAFSTGVAGISYGGPGVSGSADTGHGVVGTADTGHGVVGVSRVGTGVTGFAPNGIGIFGSTNFQGGGWSGTAAHFFGPVIVEGPFTVKGSKSVAVPFTDGSHRRLYCMESPECWFEDFGTAKLKGGRAVVKLDADFAKVITRDYRVFPTPEGDCRGLYVHRRSAASFEVRELQGGKSNVAFSYRIVGRRKDFKAERFAKVAILKAPKPPKLPAAPKVKERSPTKPSVGRPSSGALSAD